MRMVGQLIESKASLFSAVADGEMSIYNNFWVSIWWKKDSIDDRMYTQDPFWKERITMVKSGIYELSYNVNSQIEYTGTRDNVVTSAFLNDQEITKTKSYSYLRNESTGLATNNYSDIITVPEDGMYLDIRMIRNNYKGVIQLLPNESSFTLKRIRPL